MEFESRIADDVDSGIWDKVVESSNQGTIFHLWDSLKIIEKYSSTKLYPLIVQKGDIIIGCIPLFYQEKLGIKLLFCPPPHVALSRLGPLIVEDYEISQHRRESNIIEFQKKIFEFIYSELNPNYVTISSASFQDSRAFKWGGFCVEPTYNYTFHLDQGMENIWSNFKKNTRGDINRAIKRGLSVREGNKEDIEKIYELLVKRYAEQKRKVKVPKEYLMEMFDLLYPAKLRVFVVEREGNVITGNIEVYLKDRGVTWIGIAKTSDHANDLLTWECIKLAYNYGIKNYGVMGVAGDERLQTFYSKFNPNLIVSFSAKKYSSFLIKSIHEIYMKKGFLKR